MGFGRRAKRPRIIAGLSVFCADSAELNLCGLHTPASERFMPLTGMVQCRLAWAAIVWAAASAGSAQGLDIGRVMFVGNSLTYGYSPEDGLPGGYRGVVERGLLEAGGRFEFVGENSENSEGLLNPQHNGYGALVFEDLASDIVIGTDSFGSLSDWLDSGNPDVVVVDLGRSIGRAQDLIEGQDQIALLADAVFANNPNAALIWVDQVAPLSEWYPDEEERLVAIMDLVAAEAARQHGMGRRMSVAFAPDWDRSSMLSSDGVHPNALGYTYLGQQITGQILAATNAVPEPSLLAGAGAVALLLRRRQSASKNKSSSAANHP